MKRRSETASEDEINKKIRRYEKKLEKERLKLRSQEDETEPLQEREVETQPEPGTSKEPTEETSPTEEAEVTVDTLPEEFLLALGDEGKIMEQKGENIRQEVVDRWSNIIKTGIPKENWTKLINKYLTPGNFPMAIAPKLNSELVAALSENMIKRDKKFEYRQNLIGKILSCLGSMLTDVMKGNINSINLIEGINNSAKILCNMYHYDNIVRKHLALSSLQSCVKQAVVNVPADTYLFGDNLGERLKAAKAIERNGSLLQNNAPNKKQPPKFNSNKPNLNWKGPSRKTPPRQKDNNKTRGGPRNQQHYHHQQHHRRPAHRPQQSRSRRR